MQNGQTEQYRMNIRVVWSKRLISRSRLPGTMHWLPRTNECGTPWRRESDRALPPQVGVGQRSSRNLFECRKRSSLSQSKDEPEEGLRGWRRKAPFGVGFCESVSVVPPGPELFLPLFPALKRWAKLGRPSGACRRGFGKSVFRTTVPHLGG